MIKYVNHDIVFQEYPDQITLAINLSLCPNHCPGCHSAYLWQDIGEELTTNRLLSLIGNYEGEITCVGFQGGDNDPQQLCHLAEAVRQAHPSMMIGWYSGHQTLPSHLPDYPDGFPLALFDYIKLGPWREALGPLSSPTTNQRMLRIEHSGEHTPVDITARFQKR